MKKRKEHLRTALLVAIPVCLLIAALVFLLQAMGSFGDPDAGTAQGDPVEEGYRDPAHASDPQTGQTGADAGEAHAIGRLTLYYDENTLRRADGENGLVTLLADGAEELPRMDLQLLDGSLQELDAGEIRRLAVGLLQAYYVDAPASDRVTADEDPALEHAFILNVPAAEEIPAITARVRFLDAQDGLWYLTLLYPSEGQAPGSLLRAYESAAAN